MLIIMRMPAIFFGHGNPMNALFENPYTRTWRELGKKIRKPKAILCISAHWYIPEIAVTFDQQPRTIHDFGGFPRELYQVQYPASGDQELALAVQKMLAPLPVRLDHDWGLDHGTWSVLCHVYPQADVPTVQLSIDERKAAEFHFEAGSRISALREEGILIIGSGNIVHNLHTYAWGRHVPEPYDWAARFEKQVRELMATANFKPLINYENFGRDATLSIPTPDHYLPLLYVLGTCQKGERISFPVEGVDGGSISMLAVQVGNYD